MKYFYNKKPHGKQPGFLNPINKGNRPLEILHIDHLASFVGRGRGVYEICIFEGNSTKIDLASIF